MTRPQPRLPELGGMTEAGFNRVVAMIQPWDFHHRLRCDAPWGYSVFTYCDECRRAKQHFDEWRASLPKTRNKKQRKAAKRVNYGSPFPPVHCCACDKRLDLLDDWTRGGSRYCGACYRETSRHNPLPPAVLADALQDPIGPTSGRLLKATPLQRLQQFAVDTGVPVSFEIAEKAMKGGG